MVGDFLIYRVLPLPSLLFLTLAGGAETYRVTLTSISEILKINNMPATRKNKQLGGKRVPLLHLGISITREGVK